MQHILGVLSAGVVSDCPVWSIPSCNLLLDTEISCFPSVFENVCVCDIIVIIPHFIQTYLIIMPSAQPKWFFRPYAVSVRL